GIVLTGGALAAGLTQQAAAPVPTSVGSGTIEAPTALAAGKVAARAVSPTGAVLTAGGLRALVIQKPSPSAGLLLVVCGLGVGVNVLSARTADQTSAFRSAAWRIKDAPRAGIADEPPPKPEKKKPRILLLAGTPSREYQFLKALFSRQARDNHCALS